MNKLTLPNVNLKSENLLLIILAVTICLLLNVMYFISVAASPIIRDDGWYFLASQIHPWIDHGFSWMDIFVKRGLTDHAQPLNKLFLYINYRLFSLDFKYEALVGFLGVFLTVILFLSFFITRVISQSMTWFGAGFFVLAILTFTSLNSRELYSWPLVTFSYLSFFLTLLLPFLAWRFLNYKLTITSIVVAAFIFVLIGDTASIISWLSLTTAIILISISDSEISRKRVLIWIFCSAFIVASYFFVLNFNFIGSVTEQKPPSNGLDLLNVNFYFECIRIVFSSSLIHSEHLAGTSGYQELFSWLVAIPVLYFYIAHFFTLLFKKQRQTIIDFIVTFILVYATFSIAAIIVGRVPEYGVSYLNQPRYVLVYQLIPFALLMKYCFLSGNKKSQIITRKMTVLTMLPVMLYAQFCFSTNAYASVPWISKWVDGQSRAIADYVNDPDLPAGNCTNFSSPICNLPSSKRNELLNLLINNQLNLFNHEFQWKHKIFPVTHLKAPAVSAWGPQIIGVQSSDGVWIKLSAPIVSADAKVRVNVNSKSIVQIFFTGDLITFQLPDEYKSAPGLYRIEYSVDDWVTSVLVGDIEVKK
jgi:hypothetical protein